MAGTYYCHYYPLNVNTGFLDKSSHYTGNLQLKSYSLVELSGNTPLPDLECHSVIYSEDESVKANKICTCSKKCFCEHDQEVHV